MKRLWRKREEEQNWTGGVNRGWLFSGKVNERNKRRQEILNNKRCEPQYDRRWKTPTEWVQTLLAFAVVAIGYHFGTINQCVPLHPLCTSHPFPLPFGTSLHLRLALGSLPWTGQQRRFCKILLVFCISITYILKENTKIQVLVIALKSLRKVVAPSHLLPQRKWKLEINYSGYVEGAKVEGAKVEGREVLETSTLADPREGILWLPGGPSCSLGS